MKPNRCAQAAFICMFLATGCSSIKSTHVERDLSLCGWRTTKLHGTPITLTVPHHYKITIIDVCYEKAGNVLRDKDSDEKPITTREVAFEVEESQEIFTVDFVKPGAGTLHATANLDADKQYFSGIETKIVDNTIQEITNSVKTLSSTLAQFRSAPHTFTDLTITQHKRVVAVAYVDVADPTAKEKIHEFLWHHLNNCNNCMPNPATTEVTSSKTLAATGNFEAPAPQSLVRPEVGGPRPLALPVRPPSISPPGLPPAAIPPSRP